MSLKNSTLQAFAANAGIKDKSATISIIDGEGFSIETGEEHYILTFTKTREEDGHTISTPVELFEFVSRDRMMTREEARDAISIIRENISNADQQKYADILDRLDANLPSLGFQQSTPLYEYKPAKTRNAKTWTWSLNLDN